MRNSSLLFLSSLSVVACSGASPDGATGKTSAAVDNASATQFTQWAYADYVNSAYTSMSATLLVHETSGTAPKAWGAEFLICDTSTGSCGNAGIGYVTLQTGAVRSDGSTGRIASIFIPAAFGGTPAGAGTCRGINPTWNLANSGGLECEVDLDWADGGLYRFSVDKVSSDQWKASLVELGTSNSWTIGTMRVPAFWSDLEGQLASFSGQDACDRVAAVFWAPSLAGSGGARGVGVLGPGSGSCSSVRNAIGSDDEYVIQSVGTGNANPSSAALPDSCGVLEPGEGLVSSASVSSCNGTYHLDMLGGGDLALYHGGTRIWSAGTPGSSFIADMQGDGNLVVYDDGGHPVWASNTGGHSGAHLSVQDDGNVVIYDASGAIWATGTNGK